MSLSAKTKNLLDLFGAIVSQEPLEDFTEDVVMAAMSYGHKQRNWRIVIATATEMEARDTKPSA